MARKAQSKTASKATSKAKGAVAASTRWTDDQVQLLMDAVKSSRTAKEGFEQAAKQLGKNVGTVQQKYYNVQKAAKGGARGARAATRTARVAARVASPRSSATNGVLPSAADLRAIPVDDLVSLAQRVKGEVDRRRKELGAAAQLFK